MPSQISQQTLAALRTWQQAGLIDAQTAAAIVAFEQAQPAAGSAAAPFSCFCLVRHYRGCFGGAGHHRAICRQLA